MTNTDNNAMPEGLNPRGRRAYAVIMKVLTKHNATQTGGCKTFYSPAEWKARGESYCQGAELIVVYDGGDVGPFFGLDHERYSLREEMEQALRTIGLYTEEGTCWYSGVYRS